MKLENWLKEKFPVHQNGELIIHQKAIGDKQTIIITCPLETLKEHFKNRSDPPTYKELSAHPLAEQGWQPIFDQWKEKGHING